MEGIASPPPAGGGEGGGDSLLHGGSIFEYRIGSLFGCRKQRLPAGRSSLSPEHYLDLLGRKPGAVRHAAFIAEDAELAGYRDEFLRARPQQYREFVEILRLKVTAATHFSEAVRKGRESRIYDLPGFKALLDTMRKPSPVPKQKQEIWTPSLREYDRLAGGASA